jgi:hypothetical protein
MNFAAAAIVHIIPLCENFACEETASLRNPMVARPVSG